MKLFNHILTLTSIILVLTLNTVRAGELAIPNAFTAGTPAVADEVNANFDSVKIAVDDNNSRIADLEAALVAMQKTISTQASTIESLQNNLAAVKDSHVMGLNPYITVDENFDGRGPLVLLTGVNLQVVNGENSTNTSNGLGNIIIGYDEVNDYSGIYRCSDGLKPDQQSCEAAGETWDHTFRTGSHYLVVGAEHSYSQYAGIVAGFRNFALADHSTITGGSTNTVSMRYSSISGGVDNYTFGWYSSVSGGYSNKAEGNTSSVSGGRLNTAGGTFGSVSGGSDRSAAGQDDWAAGSLHEEM
ncbi:MAG: hypothetical protein HKM93_01600 [Desulfobacteraceae bacterium]|nr:hypothetical protein [Desulfobacteraceae bacterium]